MLSSFDTARPPSDLWTDLSANKCATFFQISFGLSHTRLVNGRRLSEYIGSVDKIGGARIANTIPDGKRRTAVGWRLHVVINDALRARIEADLRAGNHFGKVEDGFVHPTHKKFGFTKSYRETGDLPHFQIVLNDDNSMADVDLDVELHRSAPHRVYEHFRRRFPDVEGLYEYEA